MKNPTKLISFGLICLAAYGCNGVKTDDQKSKELMRDSVPNDTTTIQYRDTTSAESRGEIPPTPQPDTSTKK
ncbi:MULTISPECIES: hypothetical protein [Sphingobacterium]|uniref:Lipoprotein n=1 Tax=Sphingobacterium siyangense TaxID=459529 RepID=A0A562M743_9SPHI|nr:hypothetical protein [Sphingobacterium siyangense]TWI15755.1 hypothetical protein IQ31_04913 [Sphingobacterium siyangense]UQA77817.1 hypothetical protein K2F45_12865 [Sphingobacterium siyangense]